MKHFPLSIISHAELHTSSERIYTITAALQDDPFVASVRPPLTAGNAELATALGRNKDSEYTDLLFNRDTIRDGTFVGLRDYVKAFSSNMDTTKAEAGKALVDIFQKRGWSLYREGYSAETSQLNLLISDLETTEAQTALAVINGQSWLDDLKTAQQDFETTYQEKIQAESEESFPLLKEARQKVTQYLDALLSYIEMQTQLNGAGFAGVAEQIDEVTTDTTAIARARRTRSENGGEEVITEETV